jgi:hypothetical protein
MHIGATRVDLHKKQRNGSKLGKRNNIPTKSFDLDEPMATVSNESLVFYPAFCFKASPTHFTWVKMGVGATRVDLQGKQRNGS